MNLLALRFSCLSSCSYIKPQPATALRFCQVVVYHLVPTSNHNCRSCAACLNQLFIILFLHQTTTRVHDWNKEHRLFIILFLHQTTTRLSNRRLLYCCLSSCSYIKPQLRVNKIVGISSCLSSCSYIKPQPIKYHLLLVFCCLSSCSYIKPQLFPSDICLF